MKKFKYSSVLFFFLGSISFLIAQDTPVAEANFTGRWTLIGVSAFADPNSLPKYKPGAYIWDFGDGRGYQMTVSHNDSVEPDQFALMSGDYGVWSRNCLVKIGGVTYKYQFEGPGTGGQLKLPPNPDGSPAKIQLYLKTNLDPRIADGGYTLILRRM